MSFTHDVILIGQGLGGAVLSEGLAQRGLRVMIFDAPMEGRASWVATGIANPIVMRRALPSWRASEMLAIAGAFYREMEQRYERSFWHPVPFIELFPTAQEAGNWQLRAKDPELARMLGTGPAEDPAIEELAQPFGHGVVQRCAWLDMQRFLTAHRERWIAAGQLEERRVEMSDMTHGDDGVVVLDHSAPLVIHCAGAFAELSGLVPTRGEGLTVRIPGLRLKSIVHRGVFILPIGEDRFKVGSTFAWEDVWSGPTDEARRWILDQLVRVVARPAQVIDHWAGVRPTARDRRPMLGRIAPRQAVLNGMGSRGVLLAPWCAEHLITHLFDGASLDEEVDVMRFA